MARFVSVAVFMLALAGCQSRLNHNSKTDLEAGDTTILTIEAPRYDQKALIEFSSSDEPVSVYVGLKKNEAAVKQAAMTESQSGEVLSRHEKAATGSLEASIPAKEEFVVVVTSHGLKKTTVSLKITGK